MPGKQMSIDADMRSGIIDANQARDLRLALAKESQLYGAMDGAMKFVKGDVIAGIVIAILILAHLDLADTLVEIKQFLLVIRIAQRQHWPAVPHRLKFFGDKPTHILRRRIRVYQFWELCFQSNQFFQFLVKFKIGNGRHCKHIVIIIVLSKLGREG